MRTVTTDKLEKLAARGKAAHIPSAPKKKKKPVKVEPKTVVNIDNKPVADAIKEISSLVAAGAKINSDSVRIIMAALGREVKVNAPKVDVKVSNELESWQELKFEIERDPRGVMESVTVKKVK